MNVRSLELKNISLSFGTNEIFSDMSFTLEPGIYVLRGPSGCGKTTLMRMITSLEPRYTGTISLSYIDDKYGVNPFGIEKSVMLGRKPSPIVHMVHQHYTSFPWASCLDNVLKVYQGHNVRPNAKDREEAMEFLEKLKIGEHAKKRPSQISGGQDQRLSLASAFMNKWSSVFLYDEPTSALDDLNDMIVVGLIREHQRRYGTIEIITTHEDHVVQGLEGTIIELTPEFRIRKKEAA